MRKGIYESLGSLVVGNLPRRLKALGSIPSERKTERESQVQWIKPIILNYS
jgi:hypothetical protein